MNQESVIGVVKRVRAGNPRNGGVIPRIGKSFICPPKCPDRIWGSHNLLLTGTGSSIPEVKEAEVKADHSHLPRTIVNNKWRSTSTPHILPCLSDRFHLCIPRKNMSFVQIPEQ